MKLYLLKNSTIFSGLIFCNYGGTQVGNPNSPAYKPEQFYQKQILREQKQQAPTIPIPTNKGYTATDIYKQNQQNTMRQMGQVTPGQGNQQRNQIDELKEILNEDKKEYQQEDFKHKSLFKSAFYSLIDMQSGKTPFSLKEAVFMIENTYSKGILNKQLYNIQIDAKTEVLKSLFKKGNISSNDHLRKNYMIQKLYAESFEYHTENEITRFHEAFKYDFEDFFGEKDWSKMFISKLLNTGSGQCHSLPLLYLILAQETNTKAWLSLAPEHSFVMFMDERNLNLKSFETTNGNIVSYDWLMASGFINSNAVKSKLYLDTLSQTQLIGTLIADLIMSYTNLFGYDEFVSQMNDTLLKFYPSSLQGQIFKADLLALQTQYEFHKAKSPPLEKFNQYPELNKRYIQLQNQYKFLDESGYAQMSKTAYENWLKSFKKTN